MQAHLSAIDGEAAEVLERGELGKQRDEAAGQIQRGQRRHRLDCRHHCRNEHGTHTHTRSASK